MAIDTTTPHSRRALLGAAAGAVAATAVGAVARPLTAEGRTDRVYYSNDENATAVVQAFSIRQQGFPDSGKGTCVQAISDTGIGVQARSGSLTSHATVPAIQGWSRGWNTGVQGWSGDHQPPDSPNSTGVFGAANQDVSAVGVYGSSEPGTGVQGISTLYRGVAGRSESGVGVYGYSDGSGLGIQGDAAHGNGVLGTTFGSAASGVVGHSRNDSTGVLGFSGGPNVPIGRALPKTGVYGVAHQGTAAVGVRGSSTGRGGVFYGAVAQLRLEPSKLTERPAIGATGDFFVDAAGDLWFCKGDKNWVQIA